jgi:hypothetical protein
MTLTPGRQVAHVLELRVEDETRFFPEFILVHQFLEQRHLDRLAGVTPKFVTAAPAASGRGQG